MLQTGPDGKQWLAPTGDLAAALDKADELYLRLGELPRRHRSTDYSNGCTLAGISVLRVQVIRSDLGVRFRLLDQLSVPTVLFLEPRPLLLLSGVPVGVGSDGETLIRRPRVLARIGPGLARWWISQLVEA